MYPNFHDYALYELPPSVPEELEDLSTKIDGHVTDDVKTSDEFLIQLVKGYPFLYQKQNENYKDSGMKDNAWVEIGSALGLSAIECSSRWMRLRQYFIKERLKRQRETRTGSGSSKRKTWILFEQMSLLDDKILHRKTFGNYALQSTKTKPSTMAKGMEIEHIIEEEVSLDVSQENDFSREDLVQTLGKGTGYNKENSNASPASLPITEAAKSGGLCFAVTPKSGYLAGRKRRINDDPVERAFLKINDSFQLAVEKICLPSTSNMTDDEDCLFGKLVAAELRKQSGEKKEETKRKILLNLYS